MHCMECIAALLQPYFSRQSRPTVTLVSSGCCMFLACVPVVACNSPPPSPCEEHVMRQPGSVHIARPACLAFPHRRRLKIYGTAIATTRRTPDTAGHGGPDGGADHAARHAAGAPPMDVRGDDSPLAAGLHGLLGPGSATPNGIRPWQGRHKRCIRRQSDHGKRLRRRNRGGTRREPATTSRPESGAAAGHAPQRGTPSLAHRGKTMATAVFHGCAHRIDATRRGPSGPATAGAARAGCRNHGIGQIRIAAKLVPWPHATRRTVCSSCFSTSKAVRRSARSNGYRTAWAAYATSICSMRSAHCMRWSLN